jgi:hypothetical protein
MSLLLFLTLALSFVWAWGPGHHLEFSERVFRRRRELLPRSMAILLGEEKDAFFYGSIAADIINFKAYGGDYNHCHRWGIVEEMGALADTTRKEAFVAGYLSHLAADGIAHNHFVPYHLSRYARTRGLGHLYWELSADQFIPKARWQIINRLKSLPELAELDQLVNDTVPRKALSMTTNKLIFSHVLLIAERDSWRRAMARVNPHRKMLLKKGFLATFQRAAVSRIRLALRPRGLRALQAVDPNGKQAQKLALSQRLSILHRLAPGRVRDEESERLAAPFLEGMQSPPRG